MQNNCFAKLGFAEASARCTKGETECAASKCAWLQRFPDCSAKKIRTAAKKNMVKMMRCHNPNAANSGNGMLNNQEGKHGQH